MEYLIIIFVFIFGLIIGSFLNVVIFRFNTGKTIKGRSRCLHCGQTLSWFELIPFLSYLFQKGRCLKCKSRISIQYPLVEIITALLFVALYLQFKPVNLFEIIIYSIFLIITSILVVISVYDIKHKIIPNSLVYTLIVISFLLLFIDQQSFILPNPYSLLAGPILALPFYLIWLMSKGQWMGLGDAKLILGLGWILGLTRGINAIILSFWIAAIISIIYLLFKYRYLKAKTEIPFGPYLILGFYLLLFFDISIIDLRFVREVILSLF